MLIPPISIENSPPNVSFLLISISISDIANIASIMNLGTFLNKLSNANPIIQMGTRKEEINIMGIFIKIESGLNRLKVKAVRGATAI